METYFIDGHRIAARSLTQARMAAATLRTHQTDRETIATLRALLDEARALMPLGTAKRADWVIRASASKARVSE